MKNRASNVNLLENTRSHVKETWMPCMSWVVEVPERIGGIMAARLRAQDAYLGSEIAGWLPELDSPDCVLGQARSFHFMRHLNPEHLPGWNNALALIFAAPEEALADIHSEIEKRLVAQQRRGAINRYWREGTSDWHEMMSQSCGGREVGVEFATFLNAVSRATLKMLARNHSSAVRMAFASQWERYHRVIANGVGLRSV